MILLKIKKILLAVALVMFLGLTVCAEQGAVFLSGDGTENNPYVISEASHMQNLSRLVNDGDANAAKAYYKLENDINLKDIKWTAIGTEQNPFCGVFDGNGYAIKSMDVQSGKYTGLFGYVTGAKISSLNLEDFNISFTYDTADWQNPRIYVGALAAYIKTSATTPDAHITACSANGRIDVKSNTTYVFAGGLVGEANAQNSLVAIKNCRTNNEITATSSAYTAYVGGITSSMSMGYQSLVSVENSCSDGTLYAKGKDSAHAGGISGAIFSSGSAWVPSTSNKDEVIPNNRPELMSPDDKDVMIKNCYSLADMTADGNIVVNSGYVVGKTNMYSAVEKSYWTDKQNVKALRKGSEIKTIKVGTSTDFANLESSSFISQNMGFDFSNTWKFRFNENIPVLSEIYQKGPKKIFYILNEDTGLINVELKQNGVPILITSKNPKKLGCAFEGWYKDNDLQQLYTAGQSYNVDEDLVLYAQWEPMYTQTLIDNSQDVTVFDVTAHKIPDGSSAVLALYKENKLVFVKHRTVTSGKVSFAGVVPYDTARIFVFDNLGSLVPLCMPELVK